jgi:hypothetical protein
MAREENLGRKKLEPPSVDNLPVFSRSHKTACLADYYRAGGLTGV